MTTPGTTFASLLDESDPRAHEALRRLKRHALVPLAIVCSLLVMWSTLAPLSGAVIASGRVKVELNRKTVQHQEGGIVRKILAGCRYAMEIAEAEEGIAALQMMREGRFDVVFLDYNMPGLNGFETLKEIKREHPHTAVVMISSQVDLVMAERAQGAGAAAFLKKPFYPADIDSVLERHYGLHGE